MAGDYRLFIKVAIGFPEHGKTVGLSDRAFRNLVELWCYCARNLNDGLVPKAYADRLLSKKSRQELLEAPYMAERETVYEMLDYLDHQMSAKDVAELRIHRSEAGRKGGKSTASAKASAVASAQAKPQQTSSKTQAEVEVELEEENYPVVTLGGATSATNGSALRAARGTRLDPDWWPDDSLKAWVRKECPNVDATITTQNFVDYWVAKSGKDATKVDWPRTYQRWLREEQQKAGRAPASRQGKSTTDDRVNGGLSLASRLAAQERDDRPQLGA